MWIVPGLITPGQRMTIGTRKPPSQFVAFSPRNGVLPPSGQDITSAPLSVVKTTMVLSRDAEIVELLQQLSDMAVMLDHAIGIDALAGLALDFRLQMRPDMHAGRVEVAEPGLAGPVLAIDEIERCGA